MGVVIETHFWEPSPWLFLFLFSACFSSIFFLPHFSAHSSRNATLFDSPRPASFWRFQTSFFIVYSLCSVIGGLESIFGEFVYDYYGISKEQKLIALIVEVSTSFFIGSFLGIIFDLIGQKKASMFFCFFHICVGALRRMTGNLSMSSSAVCLALASSVYSFAFESWMVLEQEKLGHRQDLLTDSFWLMEFFKSTSIIGSQMLVNILINENADSGVLYTSALASFLAIICITYISRRWSCGSPMPTFSNYKMAFSTNIVKDKRIWLLASTQASLYFADQVFWIFWAPTIVADGREVHLSIIFPCLLGARMLGSTAVPWFLNGPLSVPVEDLLTAVFCIAGLALCVVAYDYQEIQFLVALFCIFQASVGLISPSLAKLRTMFVPNELRAGMIGASLAPANAALLFILIQGGFRKSLNNSASLALSALALFFAAVCIYLLKRLMKQFHRETHRL